MKVFGVFLLFSILYCSTVFAVEKDEGVYVLTTENFNSWIGEQEFALVEFYAPWCGHCKSLAPHYSSAASTLAGLNSLAKLAKVDATEHPELAQQFGVRGYPTLYWFSKEAGPIPAPYEGPREADGIVNWISKQTVNTLEVVESQTDLKKSIEVNSPNAVVVLYGESDGYSTLVSMNRQSEDVVYVQVSDSNEFGEYNNGDIVVYPSHTDRVSTQFSDSESLLNFVNSNAYPAVVDFSPAQFRRLMSKDQVIIAVEDFGNAEKKDNLRNILTSVAESKSNSVGFMMGDSNQLQRGVESAGASGKVFPTIIAVNPNTNAQIVWDETLEFTSENVGKWIDGLSDGTTTTFKKSEEIPEDDGSAVKTLVGKNFNTIKGKNALVEYYAPWCGHCKSLAPIYEELAENFKGKDVVIAKIDATANYIEENVTGFPTLIWYGADGSSMTYEGGRSLNELKDFVTSKLNNPAHHDEL